MRFTLLTGPFKTLADASASAEGFAAQGHDVLVDYAAGGYVVVEDRWEDPQDTKLWGDWSRTKGGS